MKRAEEKLSRAIAAIADPSRRKILQALRKESREANGMCASEVEHHLRLSQPTISHHMAVLRQAGLVEARKQGHFVWYQRDEKALRELADSLRSEL